MEWKFVNFCWRDFLISGGGCHSRRRFCLMVRRDHLTCNNVVPRSFAVRNCSETIFLQLRELARSHFDRTDRSPTLLRTHRVQHWRQKTGKTSRRNILASFLCHLCVIFASILHQFCVNFASILNIFTVVRTHRVQHWLKKTGDDA